MAKRAVSLQQTFAGAGDVHKIKIGRSSKMNNAGYCFMMLSFEVPGEDAPCHINAVVFENRVADKWEKIEELNEGDCVYVEGFFHTRKQTLDDYKNASNIPMVQKFPQLVVTNVEVFE